jgi:restriction endonuclease Mrr
MPVMMRLVLIDGRVLARLMVDFNIGSRSESYVIKSR